MNLFRATIAVALNACALLGADFFPLQDGNTWTYREPVSGQTLSVRVGQPTTIGGNMYYKLTGYVDSDLLVRVEPVYGALVYWDEGRNQELLLTSFEPFEGGYWLARFRPCSEQAWTDAGEARQSRRAGRSCVRCTGDPLPVQLDARMSDPCKSSMPSIWVCCAAFKLRSRDNAHSTSSPRG